MATFRAALTASLALLLSAGCAATAQEETQSISPGAGKADGSQTMSFTLDQRHPSAQFAFSCDEWWIDLNGCAVEVTLTARDVVAGGVSEVDRLIGVMERNEGDTVDFVEYAAHAEIVRKSDREKVSGQNVEFQLVGKRDETTGQLGVEALPSAPIEFSGGDRDDVYLLRVERRGDAPWHIDDRGKVTQLSFDLEAKWY